MIWQSGIFSSVALLFALASSAVASTVTGRVELVSPHHSNGRKHTDYSGVVVWLEPAAELNCLDGPDWLPE